ncbi:MAG: acyltransferase [Alphaproteobacteria bacterium]|nr:MAG: acyltransferase [Alphaproteobacteria bacterium]
MATTYRADIDGLRALAVLPVVLFHAGVPGFSGGYVGVDVFFVISGYLITGILAAETSAGRLSILGFYERRVRRILPALIAVCAVTAAAALAVMMPQDLREFGRSLAGAMLFFSNFVFAAGAGYFDAPAETKPLLHTWSLSIEEQFYLIFPWVMLWLRGRWRRPVLLALLGASLAASIAGVRFDPENAFFMPHLRAWELLLGGLIALGWPPAAPRLAPALGLAGLALVLGPVFLYDRATPFPGLAALAPCIGAGLVILI